MEPLLSVQKLHWGNAEQVEMVRARLSGPIDLVFASDVVYAGFNLGALLMTFLALSESHTAQDTEGSANEATAQAPPLIVVAYHERDASMTALWERALTTGRFAWQRHASPPHLGDPMWLYSLRATASAAFSSEQDPAFFYGGTARENAQNDVDNGRATLGTDGGGGEAMCSLAGFAFEL